MISLISSARPVVSIVVMGLALGAILEAAKLKVRAEPDRNFDFAAVKTWAWDDGGGGVLMARVDGDDPAPLKARIDPLIRQFVGEAMARKGLALVALADAGVQLHYYVLVTIDVSGHHVGQFLPAVPYWPLPPFPPATTSLNVATKGSLVLDAMATDESGGRRVIWRGVAQSTVGDTDSAPVREARLREASAELVKRFPLKKK